MKKNILFKFSGSFFLLFSAMAVKAKEPPLLPEIHEVSIQDSNVEKYGKFEAAISLSATFANPYDYSQVAVSATFTSPSGRVVAVDGFYMQDYVLNTVAGSLSPSGQGGFRVRFSPDETGTWHFTASVVDATGTATSEELAFQCAGISTPANHGFLRAGASNYLQFDDGAPYIAIGENIAWQNNNVFLNYRAWLDGLTGSGGNYFRLWHAHWGLGIEWRPGNGFEGLRRYKQSNCFYQDWLFDYCAENGVYIMLALQHHGPVSTQVNPNWNDSPYNVTNGGPCQNTFEFFTNEEARAHTKNRYRYIVARWGYSRSILCWELFNEVHWTDNFQVHKDGVAQWHFEMADYLKSVDLNGHLITTSYGDDLTDENVWSHPDFSFTQTHTYINIPNIERALGHGNRNYLDAFGKPTLNGEFGLGGNANLANQDPDGIHIHNALWGGLFSGAFGTAMTWWWDNYIHPRNLYHHFSGLSQIAGEVPFLNRKLAPAEAYATGAPGDLSLTPSLGWGGIGESQISIDENGQVSPAGAALGQFLYGSHWNTQYRSPPTFSVNYPQAGAFTVLTATETGTDPKIAIWLDGSLLLQQDGVPNSSYTITVPAGAHAIKVDNTGTDWITIASYTFEGIGSQVDVYLLVGAEKNVAAGWALNNRYNHQYVIANGEPAAAPASTVVADGFQDGSYAVRWFDPLTGAYYGNGEAIAGGGRLSVPLPSFLWDVAFIVDGTPVAARETQQELAFEIYPNPVPAGAEVNINLPANHLPARQVSLLDMGGREIGQFSCNDGRFRLPAEMPAGLYWVKVEGDRGVGARALVLTR
ncbi:MAG: DUF5060 domain-containing protein [Lewinellaceae bacterium]|nr:DUF5060 domain-containing protein [Phaeodactylibacter sp.]MCB9041604.1 DUF5060 domain-containing protein [Lewinellaceae bacterium]